MDDDNNQKVWMVIWRKKKYKKRKKVIVLGCFHTEWANEWVALLWRPGKQLFVSVSIKK